MEKDLVIIIPFINLPKYLLSLIDTICPKISHEIILVDNGSNYETIERLKKLDNKEGVTKIRNKKNFGVGGAWNQGIKCAIKKYNPKYITILNNDILLAENCIGNMIKAIEKYDIPFVSGYDMAKECSMPEDILFMKSEGKEIIRDEPQFSCFTMKAEFLKQMREVETNIEKYPGRFDQDFFPAYFEDNDFHYRIKKMGTRAVSVNNALYFHFGSRTIKEQEEISEHVNRTFLRNKHRFQKKWGGEPMKEKYKKPFNK